MRACSAGSISKFPSAKYFPHSPERCGVSSCKLGCRSILISPLLKRRIVVVACRRPLHTHPSVRNVMSAIVDMVRSAIFAERGEGLMSKAMPPTSVHRVEADGVRVFYRVAGDPTAPVILLLHGFPASSFMFRELIPRLADRYRVIAPDLPGFGFTEVPVQRNYEYSFAGLAWTIESFTEALKIDRYAIYVFDYGAPTGFRLAMAAPERVSAIISQNGNAYEEGLGDAWAPIR